MRVTSTVQINTARINQITQAVATSLEQTGEKLHTKVVQAQVMPRKDGHLQDEKFYVDTSKSHLGIVRLVFEGPYARRLYYHPEYNFQKGPWDEEIKHRDGRVSHLHHEGNPNAKGKWLEDWLPGGCYQDFVRRTFEELLRINGGL